MSFGQHISSAAITTLHETMAGAPESGIFTLVDTHQSVGQQCPSPSSTASLSKDIGTGLHTSVLAFGTAPDATVSSHARFAAALPTASPHQSSLPPAYYDEQLGESLTQDFTSLAINVTAVEQADSYGYGPAYLLNGLSNTGYWYQVGLSYDWPYQNNVGYNPGFNMFYEVWNPSDDSVFPSSGGGGILSFSGPVNPGDEVSLYLYFSGGNVVMMAYDWNTGANATETYSAEGATYFQGQTGSTCNGNGFFTGPMTEMYHVNPYYGNEEEVIYSEQGFQFTSGWLWIDEFNSNNGSVLFSSSTSSPVAFTSSLYEFQSNGATEYASTNLFITGLMQMSVTWSASSVETDVGIPASGSFSVSVQGGEPPYTYSVLVYPYAGSPISSIVYSTTSYSNELSTSVDLGTFSGSSSQPYYYVKVVDSYGDSALAGPVSITVNPDPTASISLPREVTDVGVPVALSSYTSGGTPPYTYTWYVNGQPVSSSRFYTFDPVSSGVYSVYATVTDSVGYTAQSEQSSITVNPDPTASIMPSRTIVDALMPVSFSVNASRGTPPYTYTWYVNGQPVSTGSTSYSFGPISAGSYNVTVTVTDSIGYPTNSTSVITVNSDPKFTGMTTSTSSNNLLYSDDVAQVSVEVQGGTPPYNYTWYLNGNPVATTASPSYNYSLPLGQNSLQVRVVDSVGYSVASEQVPVSTSYNYLSIGAIAAIIVAAAVVAVVFLRRRT
ncbi:MAG: PKD domain-containing protein [Conexivisphaera sp.]